MYSGLFEIFLVIVLLALGYGFGRAAERRHYHSIRKREAELGPVMLVPVRTLPPGMKITDPWLVSGVAVISVDYFKRFVAGLRKLAGGRLGAYETLLDRARREAILRMKQSARQRGANTILNVKIETSSISKGAGRSIGSVEVLAYGTAVRNESNTGHAD